MWQCKACVVLLIISFVNEITAVSEAQLQSAGKLLKKSCQPKTKITLEQIANMHKGIWDDDQPSKCYAYCMMNYYKLIKKDGKFDEEYASTQIHMLPKERQEPALVSMANCRGSDNHDEKCAAAYYFMKCVYFDNPGNFFAPK